MAWDKSKFKTYDTSEGFGNQKEWRQSFKERIGEEKTIAPDDDSPHSILAVDKGATQAQIKKAYHKKLFEWHPDFNAHRMEQATAMSRKIILAFEKLKK